MCKAKTFMNETVEINHRVRRAIKALERKQFTKLICGASNTNLEQVERLSLIYSLAGINVIDLSPETYSAAQNGIRRAEKIFLENKKEYSRFLRPVLMLSFNAGQDPHFKKAIIDDSNCINCFKCTEVCPQEALLVEDNKLKFKKDSCYGCGRCVKVCPCGVIILKEKTGCLNINLNELENVESIEIHTGTADLDNVKNYLDKILSTLKTVNLISFSVESGRFNTSELIEYTNGLTGFVDNKIIIQIDGNPMGGSNNPSSCLQSIASAQVLINSKINAYVQVAGGSNQLTKKIIKEFIPEISGIAYGTFARKIILPYITGVFEDEILGNLKRCVNITTNLVEKE